MAFRAKRTPSASRATAKESSETSNVDVVGPSLDDDLLDESTRPPLKEISVRSPFALGFIITMGGLLAIVVGAAIGQLSTIIVYIVAALFVALGLDPIVRWLEKKRMSRGLSIGVVFGAFTLIVGGLLAIIVPLLAQQIGEFIRLAPKYLTDIRNQEWFKDFSKQFGDAVDLGGLIDLGIGFINKPENWTNLAGGIWHAGIGIANGVTATIIVLILSLYFLASLSKMKQGAYSIVPRSSRRKVIDITEQVSKSIGGYVNGMVLLALLNAGLGFIAMTIFGVPFAGVVAVVVFMLALIPLIGSVLATGVVVVIGLFNSPGTAIGIGIYYIVYMQLEAYLLTPRIMNRVVSVPGSLVVIGALAGGTLLGLLGALIAIPVTAALLMIVKQVVVPAQNQR